MTRKRGHALPYSQEGTHEQTAHERNGFYPIEWIIVVAIIGILAAIALPNFIAYHAKSKQLEAKLSLSAIFTAAVAYQEDSASPQSFAPANLSQIGWVPSGVSRYSFWYQDRSKVAPSALC